MWHDAYFQLWHGTCSLLWHDAHSQLLNGTYSLLWHGAWSFIKLELFNQLYQEKNGESGGKKLINDDISKIIKTKNKPSTYLKKTNRFYFICKNLKKGAWSNCNIAPTYWELLKNSTWNDILKDLNLIQANDFSDLSDDEEGMIFLNKIF